MKIFSLFTVILLLNSCTNDKKQMEVDHLVKSELKRISFNEVDEHPYFPNCNEFDGQANLNCFYKELKKHLLSEVDFSSIKTENDHQIIVKLQVNRAGKVSLMDVTTQLQDTSNLHAIFEQQIQKMPKLFPAQKRGVLVNSVYQLPIRIKTID